MKRKFTWAGILTTLILITCTIFVACNKDGINEVVNYRGQVVYINTTTPFPDLTVKVTDGTNTHCQVQTDGGGAFSLKVHVDDIDGNYYLLAGDSTCVPKKVKLGSYGQAEVDLGVIEVEGPALPTVVTHPIQSVTANSAVLGGEVQTDGRLKVTARGVCYGKNQHPTIDGLHTTDGNGLGAFTSDLKDLDNKTTYYARAYATNKMGTAYGEQIVFPTEAGVATVSITKASTTATAMVISCNISYDGGYAVTERGICYSTINSEPAIYDEKKAYGQGKGTYSVSVTGLSPATTYYVRAYAINEYGIAYSPTYNITTQNGVSTITIGSATNITAKSASCSIKITDTGGANLKTCGICWSTSQNPTIANTTTTGGNIINTAYLCNLTNLTPSTTYYVRAYATTDVTISYSNQISFRTISGLPTVSTSNATATSTNITVECSITSDGGYNITERGVCYSINNSTPTITDKYLTAGVSANTFTVTITNVSIKTSYYVRAYAKNSMGIAYGNIVKVTTGDGLPSVTTTEITKSGSSLVTGGNVTSDGGYPVTARGVCYGKYPNPDLSSTYSHTSNGSGIGYFSSNLGSTLSGVIYVRAYATNANGTTYGNQISIDVSYLALPTFVYNGTTYRVAHDPGAKMKWENANKYCEGLELYGYSDWHLPTKDELYQMYVLRESIGGFYTEISESYYLSSTAVFGKTPLTYYVICFCNGNVTVDKDEYGPTTFRVRPIRVEK